MNAEVSTSTIKFDAPTPGPWNYQVDDLLLSQVRYSLIKRLFVNIKQHFPIQSPSKQLNKVRLPTSRFSLTSQQQHVKVLLIVFDCSWFCSTAFASESLHIIIVMDGLAVAAGSVGPAAMMVGAVVMSRAVLMTLRTGTVAPLAAETCRLGLTQAWPCEGTGFITGC